MTSPEAGEKVRDVRFDEERMSVDLADGRAIAVPLSWYPRLENATAAQRANWRIADGGYGIHWPDVDEDLVTAGLLKGAKPPGGLDAIPGAFERAQQGLREVQSGEGVPLDEL